MSDIVAPDNGCNGCNGESVRGRVAWLSSVRAAFVGLGIESEVRVSREGRVGLFVGREGDGEIVRGIAGANGVVVREAGVSGYAFVLRCE